MFKFADFVGKFPPVPMPVTLGEDSHHVFSKENKPLSDALIEQFIHPTDPNTNDDEFTEYVPCFAIDNTERFIALVWWKAALMNYEYILATFNLKGELIDRRVIAFTRVDGEHVKHAVATIDEEWIIFIAEGESLAGVNFDPKASKTYDVEILVSGKIE